MIKISLIEFLKILKKSKKYNNNSFKEDSKCLLCDNFELRDNTIKLKGFGKKGKYSIPCFVTGNNGANFYQIRFPINIKNLEKNKDYYVDYHLIIKCEEKNWNKIIKLLKNKI